MGKESSGIDTVEFRNTLGKFATGICVVTTDTADGPIGMTINSFSSVSLEPALILWNIQKSSECFQAFDTANGYAISILSDQQMDISNQFAQRGSHLLNKDQYSLGESGQAILKDAIATMECSIWAKYEGGDHIILVGEVEKFSAAESGEPLIFFSGAYRSLNK